MLFSELERWNVGLPVSARCMFEVLFKCWEVACLTNYQGIIVVLLPWQVGASLSCMSNS